MSLINQMLKDLDARQGKRNASDGFVKGLNAVGQIETSGINKKFWGAFIAVFVVLLIAILLTNPKPAKAPTTVRTSTTDTTTDAASNSAQTTLDPETAALFNALTHDSAATASQQPKAKAPAATQPAAAFDYHVTDVDWELGSKSGNLKFGLNTKAEFDVVLDEEHNVATITFPNTDLLNPEINALPKNNLIRTITPAMEGRFLTFKIALLPGVSIEDVDYVPDVKEAFLKMDLVLDPSASDDNASNNTMNKTEVPLTPEQVAEGVRKEALALAEQGNTNKAILLLQESQKNLPDYLPTQQTLITILLDSDQTDAAKQQLATALQNNPKYIPFVMMKARIQIMDGQIEQARNTLHDLSPNMDENTDYYALLAGLEQKLGNYREAGQMYMNLLKIKPSNGSWWVGYGISLESGDKRNQALMAYKRAVACHDLLPALRAYASQRISTLGGS